VRAQITVLDGYSAHADQSELLDWTSTFDRTRLQRAFVVHGEPPAATAMAEKLRGSGVSRVDVPQLGQSFEF
jgi:metallo-beta-lactamase family protein